MQETRARNLNITFVCSGIFLFCAVFIPMIKMLPYLSGATTINVEGVDVHVKIAFYFDKWLIRASVPFLGSTSESQGYDSITESEVLWAWEMLDYWGFVMFFLAIIGTLLIILRSYRVSQELFASSWLNFGGFFIAIIGVGVEWYLFYVLQTQEEWTGIDPTLGYIDLTPSLNYLLLLIHIVAIIILSLGAFPEVFFGTKKATTSQQFL
ncbi:MAG: hypothetical protein ACFFCQ_10485, partial [Promethearchaeota archaeon]